MLTVFILLLLSKSINDSIFGESMEEATRKQLNGKMEQKIGAQTQQVVAKSKMIVALERCLLQIKNY